jgi:hypothetical protein
MAESKDMVADPTPIGMMNSDVNIGSMIEQAIEDMERLTIGYSYCSIKTIGVEAGSGEPVRSVASGSRGSAGVAVQDRRSGVGAWSGSSWARGVPVGWADGWDPRPLESLRPRPDLRRAKAAGSGASPGSRRRRSSA